MPEGAEEEVGASTRRRRFSEVRSSRSPSSTASVAVGVCAALAVMQAGIVPGETRTGMRQAARALAANGHLRSDIILAAPADWSGSDLIADLAGENQADVREFHGQGSGIRGQGSGRIKV